jgi:hypothetical protein
MCCADRTHGGCCCRGVAMAAACVLTLWGRDLHHRQHLFTLLYAHVQVHTDLRAQLHKARTLDDMAAVVEECAARQQGTGAAADDDASDGEGTVSANGGASEGVSSGVRRDVFCCEGGDSYTSWYKRHTWKAESEARKRQHNQAVPTEPGTEQRPQTNEGEAAAASA